MKRRKDTRLGENYQVRKKLGKGSFGSVYLVEKNESGKIMRYAAKVEKSKNRRGRAISEYRILKHLQNRCKNGHHPFPLVKDLGLGVHGVRGGRNWCYFVMTLLGEDLSKILKKKGGRLEIPDVCKIGIQILDAFETLHATGHVHRDIKPGNFCQGGKFHQGEIHVIDLGLASKFRDSKMGYVKYCNSNRMIGTARYASLNAHHGISQTPRDDLEALSYMLISLCRGKLPWQGVKNVNRDRRNRIIGNIKARVSVNELCAGIPAEFKEFLKYSRSLGFKEKPNYAYLRKLMEDCCRMRGKDVRQSINFSSQTSKFPIFARDVPVKTYGTLYRRQRVKERCTKSFPTVFHSINLKKFFMKS